MCVGCGGDGAQQISVSNSVLLNQLKINTTDSLIIIYQNMDFISSA